MLLVSSLVITPVLAQNNSIIILNEVEPLKIDSAYKKAKFIQENGKILKREAPKVVETKKIEPKVEPTPTKIAPEEKKTISEVKPTVDQSTEIKPKTAEESIKPIPTKPEGVTITPDSIINTSPEQASKAPEVVTTPEPPKESPKPENPKLNVDQVKELIVKYSQKYDLDSEMMLRIADCESRFKTDLVGGGRYYGVFQFSKPTFFESAPKLGFQNADPLNPEQNIELAAYLFSEGQAWRWGCK